MDTAVIIITSSLIVSSIIFFLLLGSSSLLLLFLLGLVRALSFYIVILSAMNVKFLFITLLLLFSPVGIRSLRFLIRLFRLVLLGVLLIDTI